MSHLKVMGTGTGYTLISNVFIDHYMVTSGSSHLKAYLLLVRLLSDPGKEISVSKMADILDCSESDVLRSLRHWEKKGLMRLKYEADSHILTEIQLLDPGIMKTSSFEKTEREVMASQAPMAGNEGKKMEPGMAGAETDNGHKQDVQSVASEEAESKILLPEGRDEPLPSRQINFSAVSADEKFSQLMFIAEQYIGAPLSRTDCESFAWLYDGLKMNTALLEYLVESCVTNGHRSVRYMEAVAVDWHRKKIKTVEQARIYTPLHNKKLYAVMKALGLNGRQPAPSEQKIIDRWFQEYDFPLDMIVEACNRTMVSIHEPNLNYVESILSRWKKAGISRLDQVRGLDEQFQKEKGDGQKDNDASSGAKSIVGSAKNKQQASYKGNYHPSGNKPGAQFHDFEQRTYDYDELLKQINSIT